LNHKVIYNITRSLPLLFQFFLIFISVWFGASFWMHGHLFASMIVAIFVGTRLRALGNFMHECVHNSLFSSKKLNGLAGFVLSLVLWCSFKSYRKDHFSHHMFLGSSTLDMDFQRMPKEWWNRPSFLESFRVLFELRFLRVFFRNSDWQPFSVAENFGEQVVRVLFVGGVVYCCFAPFAFAKVMGWYTVFCFLFPYQMHKYLCDLWDHGGLNAHVDPQRRSRNHPIEFKNAVGGSLFSLFLNALFLPRNDGEHLDHHLHAKQQSFHRKAT
jgi:fatty acid desaturase